MKRYKQALLNPLRVFGSPGAVCDDPQLNLEQKIRILRRWEYDARELEVAEEENMGGAAPGVLSEVMSALHRLGAATDIEHAPPTKQGGR